MCPVRVHDVFLPNNTGTDLGILVTNHICPVRIQDALLPLDNEADFGKTNYRCPVM